MNVTIPKPGGADLGQLIAVLFGTILLMMAFGCGPSKERVAFDQAVENTKKQYRASDIKAAVTPLILKYYEPDPNKPLKRMSPSEIPHEISSLPIFMNHPELVTVGAPPSTKGALSFVTGSGFGHWGIDVYVLEDDPKIDEWQRKRLIPWEHGVYFYWGE